MNLQEQGMLLRQAEFTVYYRRKKCVRRVFLFEEVIIFSKTNHSISGSDTYIYKTSIKVCGAHIPAGFLVKLLVKTTTMACI